MAPSRMPVAYIPHGGGPWPFVDVGMPKSEFDALAGYLRGLGQLPKSPPKALLVVSAHWEEPVPTVMTAPRPPMLYDYSGFPLETYSITWPAPGDPHLAARVVGLLNAADIDSSTDAERGFDHGTFVPLMLAYPDAQVPTTQLSLKQGLSVAEHLAIGRALAPLRDEGVFIIGSGMSYHNMRSFRLSMAGKEELAMHARAEADAFDDWLREAIAEEPGVRDRRLARWSKAPGGRTAHPREEHLMPLMVIAGAAQGDRGTIGYNGPIMGFKCTAAHFG